MLHQLKRFGQIVLANLAVLERPLPEFPFRLGAAAITQYDRQRDFALAEIVAHRLAEICAVACIVECVVDKLERQPEVGSERTERGALGAAAPGETAVARQLGRACAAYAALVERGPKTTLEWKQYRKDAPWVLKVNQGSRTLFYLRPDVGFFHVTVLLGERSTAAALAGRVSEGLHDAIRDARKYAEGRPVRVTVRTKADASRVEELLAVKLDPVGRDG